MKSKAGKDKIQKHHLEFLQIGNEGVKLAQEENHRLGLPNVFSVDGHLVFEYPDKIELRKIQESLPKP